MSAIVIPKHVVELMATWHPNAIAGAMAVTLREALEAR